MNSVRNALFIAALFLLSVIVSVSGAYAADAAKGRGPDPFDKWWNDAQLAKTLQLDAATIRKLDALYLKHGKKILDLKAALEKNRMDVNACLEEDPLDLEETRKEYQEVLNDRVAYYLARFDYVLDVRQVIGKERYVRLLRYFNEEWGK